MTFRKLRTLQRLQRLWPGSGGGSASLLAAPAPPRPLFDGLLRTAGATGSAAPRAVGDCASVSPPQGGLQLMCQGNGNVHWLATLEA